MVSKAILPLSIKAISKSFGTEPVISDISFDLKEGEIFGLIGLNGVGKTTLIKIILDLLNEDEGEATFFGKSIKLPESRNMISYLPEKFYPSQFLKGEEFLSLSLSYYNKPYNETDAIKYATALGLDPVVFKHKISSYSKGMGQKLGLISVLLSSAPLLILDEPMSGLDPSARIQLKDLLLDYRKNNNTIFFSSHILSDIDEICDRIAVIDKGRLVFVGTPSEFKLQFNSENLEKAFLNAINTKISENEVIETA